MTRLFSSLLIGTIATAQTAIAEEGLYYGVSVGVSDSTANATITQSVSPSAVNVTLGGVAGYGYALPNGGTFAIEGTLDLSSAQTFTYSSGGDTCTDQSPDWCEVEAIARLRGVYSTTLSNGYDVLSMAGIAAVTGRAEDGPGNYVDTTAVGYTLGVGLESDAFNGTMRYELTYDNFDDHSPEVFDKTLEIVSLRLTYLF